MNYSKLISLIVVLLFIVSCKEEMQDDNKEYDAYWLDQMVNSKEYVDFMTALTSHTSNMASNTYDSDKIWLTLMKCNMHSIDKICNYDGQKFKTIRGGTEYLRLRCQLHRTGEIFLQKFPEYQDLSMDKQVDMLLKFKDNKGIKNPLIENYN